MNPELINKYNVAVPRYTSYPTVPYWNEQMDLAGWEADFRNHFDACNANAGISLYIHLPFCASLCTYCGCNKKITSDHSVESVYIAALLNEWQLYLAIMGKPPIIRELHLGGGTPTFFSPDRLKYLLEEMLGKAHIHEHYEFSFEGHPNNTTKEHLQTLYDAGFRRVSYGVQDNDPEVQRIINRIQPIENVRLATDNARSIGYRSVNFDLIYGLPRQTLSSISRTIEEMIKLQPDRIAFYSYAHVPWTSRGQRLFDESDLPSVPDKLAMYQTGKALLTGNGYFDIGMDHFALAQDDLYIAHQEGRLHRSFMGYTTQHTNILLGLGMSAISSTPGAYAQNTKVMHNYYASLDEGVLPVQKGYFLSKEDVRFGKYIMDISCNGHTEVTDEDMKLLSTYSAPLLKELTSDGLIVKNGNRIEVTSAGRNFIRNICSAFDLQLAKNRLDKERNIFSRAV